MTSGSESEQSDDEPVRDLENGLPILILGADEPIPKYSYAASARVSRARKKPKAYHQRRRSSLSPRSRRSIPSGSKPVSQDAAVSSGYEIPQEPQSNDSDSDNLMDSHFEFEELNQNDAVDNIMEHEDAGMLHSTVSLNSDLKDIYMMQILQAKAFMAIDVHHMKFLIQNFDASLKQLMIHNFCITERWIFTLANEQCWILTCSCNPSQERYVKNLHRKLNICENEFRTVVVKQFTECIHIKVCYDLIKISDSLNCMDPLDKESDIEHGYGKDLPDVQEVPFSYERLILVKPQNRNYAVVGFDRKGYVCYGCTVYRHSCIHITCVTDMLKDGEDKLPDFLADLAMEKTRFQNSQIQSRVPRSASTGRIEWETTQEQQKIYNISSGRAEFDNDMMVLLACDDGVCPNCRSELSAVSIDDIPNKRLLLWASIVMVTVISRRCSLCTYTKEYCGSSEGILNMGSFLIGHDVMRDYMYLFLTGSSCSLIGFYQKWKLTFKASGSPIDNIISYQQFRFSWYSFLNLLDIDFKDGFTCDICGPYPDVITCDATTLGFKRNFMPSPALSTNYGPVNALGGRFEDRTFGTNKELRKLVKQYIKGDELDACAIGRMKDLMHKFCQPLDAFLDWCHQHFHRKDLVQHPLLKLVKCLVSESPVCSYFPPSEAFLQLINEVKSGLEIRKHPRKLQLLQNYSPILFYALVEMPDGTVPKELVDIFEKLEEKLKNTFNQDAHFLEPSFSEEAANKFSFLPNWKSINVRGVYKQDLISSSQKKSRSEQCNKDYRGHPSLTPGIFTLYCDHDICYGFDVMSVQESPNVPFTIFRTRFPKAPRTIIYDNCCKLHTYCLGRDPGFFKHTSFFVDRFHWKNHKACADSYNLFLYPQYEKVNSQINEQRNARLKRVKSQLSYMNAGNFVNHCRLLLWYSNCQVKSKMEISDN